MRRNLIAGTLILAGALLIASAVFGLGLFTQAAAPPAAAVNPFTGLGPHRPDLLAGVHSTGPVDPKAAVAFLSVPRLGLKNVPIFDRALDGSGHMVIAHGYAVTHYQYSSAIGQGNAVLYGHDDIEGSVFARLNELHPGDEIDVLLVGAPEPAVYRVTGRTIVAPTAVQILKPTSDVRLTLFTCWPNWVDTQRVVVTAVPL